MNSISRMPPGPSLSVGEFAPLDLALDQRLHLAQALEHAEVQIAAVDERPHAVAVRPPRSARPPVTGARLDPGVALPVAAVPHEVVLEGREARHQRAGLAEGPQPHVDAEHEAVRGRRVEQARSSAWPRRVKNSSLAIGARAVGLPMLAETGNQVDVGGEVQFAARRACPCAMTTSGCAAPAAERGCP